MSHPPHSMTLQLITSHPKPCLVSASVCTLQCHPSQILAVSEQTKHAPRSIYHCSLIFSRWLLWTMDIHPGESLSSTRACKSLALVQKFNHVHCVSSLPPGATVRERHVTRPRGPVGLGPFFKTRGWRCTRGVPWQQHLDEQDQAPE